MEEIGMLLPVRVLTDSTAGKAVCHRLGAGQKLRHVEVKWFHVQDLVQKKEVTVYKVDGVSNCADLGTKPVTQAVLKALLPMAGLVPLEILDIAEVRIDTLYEQPHRPERCEENASALDVHAVLGTSERPVHRSLYTWLGS